MGAATLIAWADATFNPWWLCTAVSPACDHCYAERLAARFGYGWGPDVARRTFGAKHWNEPLRWARKAAKEGRRPRVFCASMADVFDKDAPPGERERLWGLIEATPGLDWLLLTKRVGNVMGMIPERWRSGLPPHVWLGITVVTQAEADRDVPKLLKVPARVRWLSVEPMLERIFASVWLGTKVTETQLTEWVSNGIDWVVVGGESGPGSRPMNLEWCVSLLEQCRAASVPYFFKQGSAANWGRHFKDFDAMPRAVQVREFPR